MRELTYQEKITMIQRLDERRAALKGYSQYAGVIKEIDRLISMVEVTLDPEKEKA